uniref:Uncharacterized protein n=1 Tax=Anguilla anguilla TaxID=7936 RepID=A0A0E9V0P4_ANGAN
MYTQCASHLKHFITLAQHSPMCVCACIYAVSSIIV